MDSKRQPTPSRLALSAKALRTQVQPISYLMSAAAGNPSLINFAVGLVDPPLNRKSQSANRQSP